MTLAEFLLARIAETEALARELIAEDDRLADLRSRNTSPYLCHDEAAHVAFSAGRVLVECEAQRRVVEWLRINYDPEQWGALRDLSLPHVDHPDYREEWRP